MATYQVAITFVKQIDVEVDDELSLRDFESARELAILRGTKLVRSAGGPFDATDIIHTTVFLKDFDQTK